MAAAAAVSGGAHPTEMPAASENAEVPQLETDTEGTVDPDTAATVYKVAGRGGMRELSCYIYKVRTLKWMCISGRTGMPNVWRERPDGVLPNTGADCMYMESFFVFVASTRLLGALRLQ